LPKSRLYRILRKGEVRVNKKRIKPDYRLKTGDSVRIPPVRVSTERVVIARPSPSAQSLLNNSVLYEDKHLLLINKPSGIAVHGGSGIQFGVIEIMRHMQPHATYLELAHRLDRDTSGCLLLVKKPSILKEIHELLRNGKVTKKYRALVKGDWPKNLHCIDAPLKKFELQSGERMVHVDQEGKAATTEFRVLERFGIATLLEVNLLTGRTHQIRVHAAHAGHALAGDDKYGDKEFNKQIRMQGCKRLFLHATSLSFILPSSGQEVIVNAGLDSELVACLEKLRHTDAHPL
jgi:23S rRNA pseudouridine955/2504/2580 synthase